MILLDINILLDVLQRREPHYTASAKVIAWEDFEDAVTMAAAESTACEAIVTRDARGFARSSIMVCTPEEFLIVGGPQTP